VDSGKVVEQVIVGYVSLETLDWLDISRDFNEVNIVVQENALNQEHIREVAKQVSDRLEQSGQITLGTQILKPGKHQMDNIIQSLLLILSFLGVLSLVLSGLLVFNTVSALLARQVQQIGIMKAIGAPKSDMLTMYLANIVIFGLLALIISIPMGMFGAYLLTGQLADLLNFDVKSFRVPAYVVLIEILSGLLLPILAALYPIMSGTRITVREAISSQGAAAQFGSSPIDRLVSRLQGFSASVSYAARNIFRQKVRLGLTLVTLSLGGAIFITVLSVRASMLLTINDIAAYWQQDLTVDLQRPYRTSKIQQEMTDLPGVGVIEGWNVKSAFRVLDNGLESNESINLFAVPVPSQFVNPTLLQGRWLHPNDQAALVINIDFFEKEGDIAPGDWITLKIDGRDTEWQVVGVSTTQMVGYGESRPELPMAYANYSYFSQVVGEVGQANRFAVETNDHEADFQSEMKQTLEETFDGAGIRVRNIDTYTKVRSQVEGLSAPPLMLLGAMAFLFAAVGGLSLMGTMSLNVLERTQEIGIMRSVGATSKIVMQVVITEGIFVGLVSWVLASLLAYPLGKMMSISVGIQFMKVPLAYQFAFSGILYWLIIVIILAVIASYLPARNASRMSVREVLTYE
jgi:putative ABC transport system permease protein